MENLAPNIWGGEQETRHDGDFYQLANQAECDRRRETALGAVASSQVGKLSLNDYQRWVELDWKEKHFSVEAFERFEKGFLGEVVELDQEIEPWRKEEMLVNWKSREKLQKASKESILELGDVLWYETAMLSNAQLDLESCFREYLHDKWQPVEWGEGFTVEDTRVRIQEHTPYPFSRRSVGDLFLESVNDEREISRDIHYSGYSLATLLGRVFNTDTLTTQPKSFLQESGTEKTGGLLLAFITYHAQHALGSDLEEIVAENVNKISVRVQRGHIDKEDGLRSAQEI
jgi:NTP pyrophosphatase (non-canonical NTP hydrolase)